MNFAPKHPTQRHWNGFKTYINPMSGQEMEIEEFLSYWNVTREELAFICGCSVTTVNHWFSQGRDRRQPNLQHKQRFALVHYIWTAIETEPEYLQQLRSLHNKARPSSRHNTHGKPLTERHERKIK